MTQNSSRQYVMAGYGNIFFDGSSLILQNVKAVFQGCPLTRSDKFFRLSYIDESCYNSKTINLLVQ